MFQVNYGASGWVAHHKTDIWALSSAVGGNPKSGMWQMGGAWLSTHLWEHYMFTMDKILGRDEDAIVRQVREALPRLLPTRVAKDGSIMEWAEEFEDPEVHHRHLSHIFGLFPGHTITLDENPDLCKAVETTLYKRGLVAIYDQQSANFSHEHLAYGIKYQIGIHMVELYQLKNKIIYTALCTCKLLNLDLSLYYSESICVQWDHYVLSACHIIHILHLFQFYCSRCRNASLEHLKGLIVKLMRHLRESWSLLY